MRFQNECKLFQFPKSFGSSSAAGSRFIRNQVYMFRGYCPTQSKWKIVNILVVYNQCDATLCILGILIIHCEG